jgi:hypothetical protein
LWSKWTTEDLTYLRGDNANDKVFENEKQIKATIVWYHDRIAAINGASDKVKSEVKVCEREKAEKHLEELVDELQMQQELSKKAVICIPDLAKVG